MVVPLPPLWLGCLHELYHLLYGGFWKLFVVNFYRRHFVFGGRWFPIHGSVGLETVDGRTLHLRPGIYKNPVANRINYQPPVVNAGFLNHQQCVVKSWSCTCLVDRWINLEVSEILQRGNCWNPKDGDQFSLGMLLPNQVGESFLGMMKDISEEPFLKNVEVFCYKLQPWTPNQTVLYVMSPF